MIQSIQANFARLMDESVNEQLMNTLSNLPLILEIGKTGFEVNYTLPEAP